MTSIRSAYNHENPYAQISKKLIDDTTLSSKAYALIIYLIGRPPGWKVVITHLKKLRPKEGKDFIYAALKELQDHGYVKRIVLRNLAGKITGHEYVFSDNPELLSKYLVDTSPYQQGRGSHPLPGLPELAEPELAEPILLNNKKAINNKRAASKTAAALSQNEKIKNAVIELLPFVDITEPELTKEIKKMIVDPKAFSQAQGNFDKKLNTIKKQVKKEGIERPSSNFKESAVENKETTARIAIRRLQSELDGTRELLKHAKQIKSTEAIKALFAQCDRKQTEIEKLELELKHKGTQYV